MVVLFFPYLTYLETVVLTQVTSLQSVRAGVWTRVWVVPESVCSNIWHNFLNSPVFKAWLEAQLHCPLIKYQHCRPESANGMPCLVVPAYMAAFMVRQGQRKEKAEVGEEIEKGNGIERNSNRGETKKRGGGDRKGENTQRNCEFSQLGPFAS